VADFLADPICGPGGGFLTPPLVIGLVNSMPGEAFGQTERQFRTILSAAARGRPVHLRLFSLDPPAPVGGDTATSLYQHARKIDPFVLDGLIVTGMPPRASRLVEEPCWEHLTALADLAMAHGIPTVWSCLAAHAAVLYLDGIERQRLPEKLSGLFACTQTDGDAPITAGLPRHWHVPHSRYNDLPAKALVARDYRILSSSDDAGADLFAKDAGAPFVFCQGHPEYDALALLREYRRDIRQYLTGARDPYPAMPQSYFSPGVTALLEAFRERALGVRTAETMADFPLDACEADLAHSWSGLAHAIYANWLTLVAERKACRSTVVRAA